MPSTSILQSPIPFLTPVPLLSIYTLTMAAASPYLIASASNPTFVADLEGSGEGRNISL